MFVKTASQLDTTRTVLGFLPFVRRWYQRSTPFRPLCLCKRQAWCPLHIDLQSRTSFAICRLCRIRRLRSVLQDERCL